MIQTLCRSALAAGLAALISGGAQAGQTLVVDSAGGPGVDYTTLQAAVDGAADGDLILVQPGGSYGDCVFPDKSLTVCGDWYNQVHVDGTFLIQGGSPQTSLTLRGLEVHPAASQDQVPVVLSNWQGRVWAEECSFVCDYTTPMAGAVGHPGTRITNCASVVFKHVRSQGGFSDDHTGRCGSGVEVTGSTLALFSSACDGRQARWVQPPFPGPSPYSGNGGHGLVLHESYVYAQGSTLHGAAGGSATTDPGYGGDGGDGVVMSGTSSVFEYMSCGFFAGAAGTGTTADGVPGVTVLVLEGVRRELLPPGRELYISAPTREGSLLLIQARGVPGDVVHLVFWPESGFDLGAIQDFSAPNVIRPGARVLPLGTCDATGWFSRILPAPQLQPWEEFTVIYAQPLIVGSTGTVLGSPSTAVIVDTAF